MRNAELELVDASSGAAGDSRSSFDAVVGQHNHKRKKSAIALLALEELARTKERRWSVAVSSLVTSITSMLMGATMSLSSSAALDLTGEAKELSQDYLFSTLHLSLFAALPFVGAIFGGPIGGWVADRWGRKCSLLFCGVPYLIGYLTISYAHYTPTATIFKAVLLTGCFITGVGMGWASAVAPVYIAEICSRKTRGMFGSFFAFGINAGVCLYYGLGAIDNFPYYYTSLVAVGLVVVFEILMVWLPETPRWLLCRGYGKETEKVLLWLRGNKIDIKLELDEIKKSLSTNKTNKNSIRKEFQKRNVFLPFLYVLILFFFQQGGGINGIVPFTATLLSDAGVSNPRTTATYVIGGVGSFGLMLSLLTIDLIGRTVLLQLSTLGMLLSSSMLGIHYFITRASLCSHSTNNSMLVDLPCNDHFQPLAIVSVALFICTFVLGMDTIPWILMAELIPLTVRGVASGMITVTTWGTAAVFSGVFLPYYALVGPWFTMWSFALINLLGALFVFFFIPETRGKSLEEMEKKFERQPKAVETVL